MVKGGGGLLFQKRFYAFSGFQRGFKGLPRISGQLYGGFERNFRSVSKAMAEPLES